MIASTSACKKSIAVVQNQMAVQKLKGYNRPIAALRSLTRRRTGNEV